MSEFDELIASARVGDDADAAVALARTWGARLPTPGGPGTATRFAVLRAVAAVDLTAARVLEAHADALAILGEAGETADPGTAWGVYAAEGSGHRVTATTGADGVTRLDGVKPWCSIADRLDRALVTAHVGDERGLFLVDLHHPGVRPEPPDGWAALGLRAVTSGPIHLQQVPALPLGPPGWYLRRPGFAWGGIGVAACWLGGVDGLAASLHAASTAREGDLAALHVGTVDVARYAADRVLADAVDRIASGRAAHTEGRILAGRVRAVVADTVERVVRQVGHALGPGPLAFDADHARRVADLALYVRQHHAERDLVALGRDVLASEALRDDGAQAPG